MRTGLTLRPGKRGTRALCEQYGEPLVCGRYRYDESRKLRFKTVELIVGERPWVYCRPWREIPSIGRSWSRPATASGSWAVR